jgi:hypothetical protein
MSAFRDMTVTQAARQQRVWFGGGIAMNVYELDCRIDPLYAVIVGIDAGLAAIGNRIKEEEGFDGLTARCHAEPLFGLGFVAAQTYAHGTWTDLNRIRKSRGKPELRKSDCYKCDAIILKAKVTRIEVINAAANYFKHHEEWSQWPTNETTETLRSVGITQTTELPCIELTELFCGNSWEFVVVHQVVKEWREHVMNKLG